MSGRQGASREHGFLVRISPPGLIDAKVDAVLDEVMQLPTRGQRVGAHSRLERLPLHFARQVPACITTWVSSQNHCP